MKAAPLLFGFAVVLTGCGGGDKPKEPEPAVHQPAAVAPDPATTEPTKIALFKNGERVDVGSDPQAAFDLFRGDKPGGFVVERLPKGFASPYQARAWQGANEGFGVITHSGRVVMAMYQQDGLTQEEINTVVDNYRRAMSPLQDEFINGQSVNYWFWQDAVSRDGEEIGTQRLMIMAYQGKGITVAMGDSRVLDELGINPSKARQDQMEADSIIRQREAGANASGQ